MERIKKGALWVFCEAQSGSLLPVALQLTGRAGELARRLGAPLYAVLIGPMPADAQRLLAAAGADMVICCGGPSLEVKLEGTYAECLIRLAREHSPEILLAGATPFGRSFLPRVAAALGTGLTADCTQLDVEAGTGLLLQTRPAFGGNLMATIRTAAGRPQMATVRPGVLPLPDTGTARECEAVSVGCGVPAGAVELLRESAFERGEDISRSRVIVSAGRGVGDKKGLKLVKELADRLGGCMGASRPLVDMGFCPYSCQIGQTGSSVSPELLICCGISGAVQHLAGIGGAKTVIAINTDPSAPIFSVADYCVVGDCIAVLSELLSTLRA